MIRGSKPGRGTLAAFAALREEIGALLDTDLPRLEADFASAGAPWMPGRRLPDS